ncbi:MAG: hypothetical protein EBR30_16200 [Cytophagia bacterium]|nr:hypothetical protein [Cytophagia bacterium]
MNKVNYLILLLAVGFYSSMAQSNFLDQIVQLDETEITFQELITAIENQTEIRFAFNPNTLPLSGKLLFKENKVNIRQALNAVNKTFEVNYIQKDKIILLKKEARDKESQVSVYGYIKDAQTGESLIAATVIEKGTAKGTTSNFYGYYSHQISINDPIELLCSYVGYQPFAITLKASTDTLLNINLVPQLLDEVVVLGSELETVHEKVQMSSNVVAIDQVKKMPAFLGEVDVLKVLQLLPGIKSSEGSTGLYVRGGGSDQNLILLDGVPVYNASHLFGFFSLFNADAINHVELIKGGFPARYGDGKAVGNYKFGQYVTTTTTAFNFRWGNVISALRWNRVITPKLFANATTTYSRYRFVVNNRYDEITRPEPANYPGDIYFDTQYNSGIRDLSAKLDFEWLPNTQHYVRFGISSIDHHFTPGVYAKSTLADELDEPAPIDPINATESSVYAEDDWMITDRLKINAGLHASVFKVEAQSYQSLQPRFSARYLAGKDLSVKASYTNMTQFIHFLTNAGIGLPTDMWLPSTKRVAPQQAWQGAFGVAKTYQNTYEISVEGYFKEMTNLIEYKDGATYTELDNNWQDKIVMNGLGRSYGAELFLQKKEGNFTGWIGYTLSWTNRKFDDINQTGYLAHLDQLIIMIRFYTILKETM